MKKISSSCSKQYEVILVMTFDMSLWFISSVIIYILMLIMLVMKKKYSCYLKGIVSLLYFIVIFFIGISWFPFSFPAGRARVDWSLIPFQRLLWSIINYSKGYPASVFRGLAVTFTLSFVVSLLCAFCIASLSKNPSQRSVLTKSMAIIYSIELIGFILVTNKFAELRSLDTGVFIVELVGAFLGYFCFMNLPNLKTKKRENNS